MRLWVRLNIGTFEGPGDTEPRIEEKNRGRCVQWKGDMTPNDELVGSFCLTDFIVYSTSVSFVAF